MYLLIRAVLGAVRVPLLMVLPELLDVQPARAIIGYKEWLALTLHRVYCVESRAGRERAEVVGSDGGGGFLLLGEANALEDVPERPAGDD